MYEFGSRLKKLRISRGFTQKALAGKINKSKSAISSYESNAQIPPLDVIISMAGVLDVSLDYLVGFERSADYSVVGLSEVQIAFLDRLFCELRSPTYTAEALSPEQTQLVAELIELFRRGA